MTTKQVQPRELSRQLQFGAFWLDTHNRVIGRGGSALRLGGRARDILTTLLEHAGETVAKKELMARVWPHTVVDEGTLRVHISALRKALDGSDSGGYYIENVTGHGYRFVAPIRPVEPEQVPRPFFPLPRLIGRAGPMSTVIASLPKRRLVTVVGPGGAGKTALVLSAADRLRESYPDGEHLVDVTNITDPSSIGRSVATALGVPMDSDDALSAVVKYLQPRRTLLILEGCERVVDGAAFLAEELLGRAPNLNVVVTSREPLRAKGEWVLRLGPLALPSAPDGLTVEQALQFPAIRLFVERATARLHNFELHDPDVGEVAEICRRLDGLPLGIELAAALVEPFGVRGLAAHLYDRPGHLTGGYKAAIPRHRSLRASLAWSYETLTPVEQIALRRLAVFPGPFDLASATAVVVDDVIDATNVLDILASLADKSLLVAQATDERSLYRLLETSRTFALEKLECSRECVEIRRCHAWLKSGRETGQARKYRTRRVSGTYDLGLGRPLSTY
jgi:predicted ATPase/DNA-binding winged helix-turn-helix (wHTH) protein